jgi:hypothetical protein
VTETAAVPPSLCTSCGTTMTAPSGPTCDRCVAAAEAVRQIRDADAALERARSDMAHYARERTRIASAAVAAGVRPAVLARGLGLTRQRINSLLKRAGDG